MNIDGILINKELPAELFEKLKNTCAEVCEEGEKLLFAIVGDLTLAAKYDLSVLAVTEKRSMSLDSGMNIIHSIKHEDTENAAVKRMYGNARLTVTRKGGEKCVIFRFTYSVATLCEMAASYIKKMSEGEDIAHAY
ncbi:MAG: hypothetical protein IJN48_06395, partial [Clostridia bacterium]|nr:hypothetical protein [Clostridia bacterium]